MEAWAATITLAGVLPHFRMLPTVLTKMLPPPWLGLEPLEALLIVLGQPSARDGAVADAVPRPPLQQRRTTSSAVATDCLGLGPAMNEPRPKQLREPAVPALQGLPHPADLADNVRSLPPDRCRLAVVADQLAAIAEPGGSPGNHPVTGAGHEDSTIAKLLPMQVYQNRAAVRQRRLHGRPHGASHAAMPRLECMLPQPLLAEKKHVVRICKQAANQSSLLTPDVLERLEVAAARAETGHSRLRATARDCIRAQLIKALFEPSGLSSDGGTSVLADVLDQLQPGSATPLALDHQSAERDASRRLLEGKINRYINTCGATQTLAAVLDILGNHTFDYSQLVDTDDEADVTLDFEWT